MKTITVPRALLVTVAGAVAAWTRCVPAAWVITIAVIGNAAWAWARSYAWTTRQFAAAWAWMDASFAGRDLTIPGWSEHWLWGGLPRQKPADPAPDTTGSDVDNVIATTARTGLADGDQQSTDEAVA